mgnify:CR=1 FL=1
MKFLSSLSLKAKIIAGAAATAVAAGTITLVLVLSSPDAFRLLKVFEMMGKSTVTRMNTGAMDAYVGMNLESGDVIEVGETSTMTLSLDSDKYLTLDPSTVLELIAEGTEQDSKTSVNLRSGGVLNEITEPLSDESSYSVNTPKATMAVRGTSFYVSVKMLDDGSYITDVSVFHGKVEIQLLDEEGNPRGEPVIIEPNESVAVLTLPAEGNTVGAEINGTSMFIIRKADGSDTFAIVGEGEDPVMPLNVYVIPASVIERVLNTHDNTEIVLSEEVLRALLGDNTQAEGIEKIEKLDGDDTEVTETSAETEVTTTVPETTTASETTPSETTVPVTETSVEETTVTTVPITEEAAVTTVSRETAVTEKTTVTTEETEEFVIVEEEFEDPRDDDNEEDEATASEPSFIIPPNQNFFPVYTRVPDVTTTTVTTTTAEETTTPEETTTTEETTEEEPSVYWVTFVSNPGGEMVAAPQEVEEGGYAVAPTEFTEQLYINGAWYVCMGVEDPLGPITADTEISVKYVDESTVIHVTVSDNGTQIDSVYRARGESYTLPAAPTGDGVLPFRYWGLQQSGMAVTPYQPNQDITVQDDLTVGYKDGSYTSIMFNAVYGKLVTVTFLDYNGTVLGTAQGYQGESVDLPANPTREGYTFDDWYTTNGGYYFSGYIDLDMTEDFSVTAKYTGNPVTFTFTCNGVSYVDENPHYVGDIYEITGSTFNFTKYSEAYAAENGGATPAAVNVSYYNVTGGVDNPGSRYIGDTINPTGNVTIEVITSP